MTFMRDEAASLDQEIAALLADAQYAGHPLRAALAALMAHQQEQITQLERLTSISDGYQSVLQQRNQSLAQRHQKQVRQLQKIVRISDHYQGSMRDLNEALKIASTQDPLTGLFNRRLMLERLKAEEALAKRRQTPFSIAMIDIDHFKRINDEFGHDVGDTVLVQFALALTGALRAYDICARWGGEEFLVLLPETSGPEALEIANRLRILIEELQIPAMPAAMPLSVSIGLAQHDPESDTTRTMKRADDALYQAKRSGRNRVVLLV